jgi:hypothetical protein
MPVRFAIFIELPELFLRSSKLCYLVCILFGLNCVTGTAVQRCARDYVQDDFERNSCLHIVCTAELVHYMRFHSFAPWR